VIKTPYHISALFYSSSIAEQKSRSLQFDFWLHAEDQEKTNLLEKFFTLPILQFLMKTTFRNPASVEQARKTPYQVDTLDWAILSQCVP
jgi:hypothetical protein